MLEKLRAAWELVLRALANDSPYRGPILGLLALLLTWILYKLVTMGLRRYVLRGTHKPENVENFFLLWRYAWFAVALIFVLVSYSGSLAAMGISAAFLGMVLGWSLQAPVTGMAAWLLVILKRPFRIGDRVIIKNAVVLRESEVPSGSIIEDQVVS